MDCDCIHAEGTAVDTLPLTSDGKRVRGAPRGSAAVCVLRACTVAMGAYGRSVGCTVARRSPRAAATVPWAVSPETVSDSRDASRGGALMSNSVASKSRSAAGDRWGQPPSLDEPLGVPKSSVSRSPCASEGLVPPPGCDGPLPGCLLGARGGAWNDGVGASLAVGLTRAPVAPYDADAPAVGLSA